MLHTNTHRPYFIRELTDAEEEQSPFMADLPRQTPWTVLRDHPTSFGKLCGVIGLVILFAAVFAGGMAIGPQ